MKKSRAAYMRERRALRPAEEVAADRRKDRDSKRNKRAELTLQDQAVDKEKNRQREQQRRSKRTANEVAGERQMDRQRKQKQRAERTPEQISVDNQERAKRRKRMADSRPEFISSERMRRRRAIPPSKYIARDRDHVPQQHYLGQMDAICGDCQAKHFEQERTQRKTFSTCCGSGTISLPVVDTYPSKFEEWLTQQDSDSKNFRTNIRQYNNMFAFASLGYQPVKFSSGPQPLVIHGQVYHRTSTNLENKNAPQYSQLYFLDPDFANQQRSCNAHNEGCKLEVIQKIDQIIRDINPYAKAIKMMKDVVSENPPNSNITMCITKDRQHDPRRYNLPVANEVAAVFISDDGEIPFDRDIAYQKIGENHLQNISIISPNCDPMTYPLLFPNGKFGWQPGIPKRVVTSRENANEDNNSRNVSMLEFYSFRLQERDFFNPLLHSGKLTQQFIIDAFMKIEGQRLHWSRQNQKTLRVELYLGLMDYVNHQAEQRELKAGRIVILPSSFTGGKRYMQQNYQDAMVLVAKFGKPDLFVTFTCNPKWKEITDNLKNYETATDRPDLVATVFYLKLKEFLDEMTCPQGGVLGKVKAYMTVIEFQKRGLPHCHMLFILNEEDKLRQPEDIDSVVCAEIPSEDDPELLEIVKTCMMHGPCGDFNKKAPCMVEDKGCFKCSKDFPKQFSEGTNPNNDGYPIYQRRNNGRSVEVRGAQLDNRWVVPYNPYLTRKYNAHINVEVCSSVQSVKYIFKYIYKGHDAALVQVNEASKNLDWDEIRHFLDTRYISAPEAIWRTRKYDMFTRSHAVERLPVHLPSNQAVVFQEGREEEALRQAEQKGTKLTKWFDLNKNDMDARNLLYSEIPYHYVWCKNSWKKRQRGGDKKISRLYSVSPKDMERFCLRLLLLHIKGAQSFEGLRTINGVLHETFQDAAKAMNLLDDDQEWYKTMDEAVVFRMPSELRQLFVTILVHGDPTGSKLLYEKYKDLMYEDYLVTHSAYMAEQLALRDIEMRLSQFGRVCKEFGLPTPVEVNESSSEINEEFEREEAERMVSLMNEEQRKAFEIIMKAVNGGSKHKCYFLSGAGGTGKTFVYKALTSMIYSRGGYVKSVAPTGLAATLLKGGKTVHSGFGIPIDLTKNSVSRIKHGSPQWKELKRTKLIIWDEISMCHVYLLNAVDRSLRDLLGVDEPFGGITIVVGGDFRQQAPVVLHGNRVNIVEACVKSSNLWRHFKELPLLRNMRVNQDEVEFSEWLLSIGSGITNGEEQDFAKIPSENVSNDVVTDIFGTDITNLQPADLASRAILCPKNEDTLRVNERVLRMLEGNSTRYCSVDSIECENEEERNNYPVEFLNSLTPMGMPPHILNLKKGCCVMLLRNLDPKFGLCNGTRLIVESMRPNLIECSIFSGERSGRKVLIPRINLDVKNGDLPFQLKRKQFPLRLAYSMTITKSQGQTFDRIGVMLPEPVFTHGQLYTAFSRVRSKGGLFVEVKESSKQGAIYENDSQIYTYNCVFREILK